MRKTKLAICLAALLPMAAMASDLHTTGAISVTFVTNGTPAQTAAFIPFSGYIQEILLDVVGTEGSTGTVSIVAASPVSTMAARSILSATVTGDAVYRPRFNGHDNTGSSLANYATVAEPFMAAGEAISLLVTNISSSATSMVFTAYIKYSEKK